jgi:S-DNA-T family DNA segregation ATPase FtsK/SpoIIIE
VGVGALILVREVRPAARPMRTGIVCLTISLTLALAAGTLGLGPGAVRGWNARAVEARGGILGQSEFWVASHLVSTLGADMLAVFLFIASLILINGATVAGVVRTTSAGIRRSTEDLAARRPATAAAKAAMAADLEPQPQAEQPEVIVRPTHVEAPPITDEIPELDEPRAGTAPP